MKKTIIIIIMLALVIGSVFINIEYNKANTEKNDPLEFADIRWIRYGEEDTEYLRFKSDGTYSYYCACGNPVNDSDLCETYTYDSTEKIINLNCSSIATETVTSIKIISYEEDKLILEFDGEVREFERELEIEY